MRRMVSSHGSTRLSQYEVSKWMNYNNYLYKIYDDLEYYRPALQGFKISKSAYHTERKYCISEPFFWVCVQKNNLRIEFAFPNKVVY